MGVRPPQPAYPVMLQMKVVTALKRNHLVMIARQESTEEKERTVQIRVLLENMVALGAQARVKGASHAVT